MKNKSKITGIRQQAQKSVDKSESSINRFASFMGVLSKGITKDIPDKKTIKKARLFAKNFGGGRSSKVNKMLLGGAIMLPLVLGQMMSKERSTEELLQTQYGGNEKAMQKDLDEEQKVRDEGIKKVKTTADENKDIALDKKKDLQAVSQKGPEEAVKSEVNSDDSTLERMNDRVMTEDQGMDKTNVDKFDELMDRFVFLAKQGAFTVDKGPSIGEQLNNFRKKVMSDIRQVTGGKVDDGVFSLGLGVEVANPFSEKGRNIIKNKTGNWWNSVKSAFSFGPKDKEKNEKSDIETLNEVVAAQIEENERKFQEAGGITLKPGSPEITEYLTNKSELEKLQERLRKEPFTVIGEFMAKANPSSVSAQTSMLSVDTTGIVPNSAEEIRIAAALLTEGAAGTAATDVLQVVANRVAEKGGRLSYTDILASPNQFEGVFKRGLGQFKKIETLDDAAKWIGGGVEISAIKRYIADMRNPKLRADSAKFVGGALQFRGSPRTVRAVNSDNNPSNNIEEIGTTGIIPDSIHRGGDGDNQFLVGPRDPKLEGPANVFYEGMGDQSSLRPNNPNMIAQFTPEGYMPYDDPAGSETQIVAFTPQMQPTNQPGMVVAGGDSTPQIIAVADVGSVLSQIQLNNLART